MPKSKIKNSFVFQGSILAIAGILVRIIGLIYRIPLTNILGEVGMGIYGSAFDVYNLLLLISTQSMPVAISKLVSQKLGKNENNNAHKIFIVAFIYSLIIGVGFGLFTFFGADWIAATYYSSGGVGMALKVLAPTITIVCVLAVFRGYMQGMGDMVPTAISQIFEQIINAIVSVVAASELLAYGYSVSKTLSPKKQEIMANSFGAAGGTLGTCLGALTALIVLIFIYVSRRKVIKRDIVENDNGSRDSIGHIAYLIVFTITPMLLSTTIYNISNLLDNPIFQKVLENIYNKTESEIMALWGIYGSQYRVLTTMPIAIASSLAVAIVPSMIRSYASGDNDVVKNKIESALKFSILIAMPSGIGLSILGGPINKLIFPSLENDLVVTMMLFSVFTVVAFSISTISNSILQGIDKLKTPIKNSAIALVIHIFLLLFMLIVLNWGIYSVVIGDFTFAMTVCLLNSNSIYKYTGYKQNILNTMIKPLLASIVMGVFCVVAYYLTYNFLKSNVFSTLFAVLIAVIVYVLMVVKCKIITEKELETVPKGTTIIRLLKKIHIM